MTSSFFEEIGAEAPQWEVVPAPVQVHRPLPAIPEPTTTPVPAMLDACQAVVAWAEQCDDVEEVREVYDRMTAVAKYLARQDHALAAETAMRRLEQRIGELTPSLGQGTRTDLTCPGPDRLPRQRAAEFRQIAQHPEVVEQVIAESTEKSPPSRSKVLEAIKNLETVAKEETRSPSSEPKRNPLKDQTDRAGWDLRKAVEKLERLFEDDRFRANRETINVGIHANLAYAAETCQQLLNQLENR